MTRLWLVRHCEAEGNRLGRCHGAFDAEVTPRGRAQIEALRARFLDVPLDAVYASDLYRARETARALAEPKDLTIGLRAELRELHMGRWEDLGWGTLAQQEPDCDLDFIHSPHRVDRRVSGGECVEGVGRRTLQAIQELLAKHEGGDIAVVFHGMATRAFLCAALGMSWDTMNTLPHVDNTGITMLMWDGVGFTMDILGDNSHLMQGQSTLGRQKWHRGIVRWADLYLSFERTETAFVPPLLRQAAGESHLACVGYLGENPVGIAALRMDEMPELTAIHVLPAYHGQGFEGQLLGEALYIARNAGAKQIAARESAVQSALWLESHLFMPREGQGLWTKRLFVDSLL